MKPFILVKGEDRYLYRAVDSKANNSGLFTYSQTGCALRAKRFFRKTLRATHTQEPLWINVDKNADEPKAIERMKAEEGLPGSVKVLQNKYLNNRVEQDHRFIKRLTRIRDGISLI